MPNFRHLITIVECFLTLLSIKYWRYVVSFCRNAKFCSGDRKFNHLFHWQIALYMPVITKWLLSDQFEIYIIQDLFSLPRLSKYRKGLLEIHIKIHFLSTFCCFFIHFPRITCICSKCFQLYIMMVKEISRFISPEKIIFPRGQRPRPNMIFLGE